MSGKETSLQQDRYNQKIKKILSIAARLFAKKGYEKVSIEEIAAKLSLTKGSLYHYFRSKEEVLFYIQMDALEIGNAALTEVLNSDLDPVGKLTDAIRIHVEIITRREISGALQQPELLLPPLLRARVIESRDRYDARFRRIISEGVAAGVFDCADPRLSSIAALSVLNGIAKWYSPKGEKSVEEIADAFTDFIVRGFGARPSPKPPRPEHPAVDAPGLEEDLLDL